MGIVDTRTRTVGGSGCQKLRLKSASKAFFDKFAVSAEETLSKSLSDFGDRQWAMLLNGRGVEQRDGKEPLLLHAIEDVTARKRAEETLRTHAEGISRLARGLMGRELRIIEMKKEVNELCHRLGEVGRYPLEFEQDAKERPDSPRPRNQP